MDGAYGGTDADERIKTDKTVLPYLPVATEERAGNLIEACVARGTAQLRTHVDIDLESRLLKLDGALAARERLRGLVSVQIVAFPQSGVIRCPESSTCSTRWRHRTLVSPLAGDLNWNATDVTCKTTTVRAEMSDLKEAMKSGSADAPNFKLVADILGGPKILKWKLKEPLDVHELLLRGLPGAAWIHLVDSLALLHDPVSLEKAVGISLRTFQRRKANPTKLLNREQSGRTWKFAEILAKATAVLGSRTEAEQWLERPAIGLNQRRPIDLLATAAGVEIVENHLERIEYGVYM